MSDRMTDCIHCGLRFQPTTPGNRVACPGCGVEFNSSDELPARLDWNTCQQELARLDQEWERERAGYLVMTRYGRRVVPSVPLSIAAGVGITLFGTFWSVTAYQLTALAGDEIPDFIKLFPLYGVLFVLAGIAASIYSYRKAVAYEKGFERYHARRAALLVRLDEPAPPAR